MAQPSAPSRNRFHPTWWMLSASIISVTSLFLMSPNRHPGIPLLLCAIVASYFLRMRLPAGGPFRWIIRGVLWGIIIMTAPEQQSSQLWYLNPAVMSTIGMCLEVELAMQHFLPIDGYMRLGQLFVLTAGILVCGSVTSETRFMAALAPLYVICVLGIIRQYRPSVTNSPTMDTSPPKRTSRRWLLHGSTIVLALTMGFAGGATLRGVYMGFGGFGTRLLQRLIPLRIMGGMSGNEQLRGEYNPEASTGRNLKIYGTNRAMHLRGLTFDTYQGGRWLPLFDKRQWASPADLGLPAGIRTFRVERLEDPLQILYLPLGTPGFTTPPKSSTQREKGHRSVFQTVTERGETLIYTVAIPATEEAQGPLCAPLSDSERTNCLAVPGEIEAGVREIATKTKQPTPAQTIRETIRYLQDHHTYSLKSDFTSQRDPVSSFLLEGKSAHCQFFASAAAILLRLNGVPCRYVTGYFAHEPTSNDSMVVRGRDAHAWVEAWLDGVGWITVEATPANGTPGGKDESVGLYQRIKDFLSDMMSAIGGFIRSLSWHHIAIGGSLLVLFALGVQWIKAWRTRGKRQKIRNYAFPDEEYRRLAIEFEQHLKRMGEGPSGTATWSEHLSDLSAQTRRTGRQMKLDAAQRFVDAYNRTRFGRPADMDSLRELHHLLEQVKDF